MRRTSRVQWMMIGPASRRVCRGIAPATKSVVRTRGTWKIHLKTPIEHKRVFSLRCRAAKSIRDPSGVAGPPGRPKVQTNKFQRSPSCNANQIAGQQIPAVPQFQANNFRGAPEAPFFLLRCKANTFQIKDRI